MKNDDIKYELWKDFKLSTINIDQYRSFLPSLITRVSILRRIKNRLGIIEFLANDKIMSSLISSRLKKIKNLSVSIMYSFSNGWVTMRGKCGVRRGTKVYETLTCKNAINVDFHEKNSNATIIVKDGDSLLLI